MSTVLRRSSILLVALFILVTVAPSVAVADEALDWPDSEPVNDSKDPNLDAIDVEYQSNDGDINITINTTSNGGGDDDLLANNITDVYIDTGDPDGIDDSTFTGGSETATFWGNLEINADYRVAIGDDTNVVEPWDEDTTQFDGTESESITIDDRDNESITVKFNEEVIDSPETIDFQAAFVEGDGFDDSDGYAWAKDQGDIILQESGAVISAEINITDADVDDDAAISVSAGGESEDVDINGNNNLTAELTVDTDVEEVTATIEGGTNYTLDKTKDVGLSEGDEEEVDFDPHRLIDVEGEMINGGDEDYTIELQDSDGDPIVESQVFDTKEYPFEDINATRLANGTLVANIVDEESLKSVNKTTVDLGDIDRFEPDDPLEIQDLKIEPPTERLEIETNRSVANISKHDTFNVTVNATADGDDRIDTVKHVVEFDDEQIEHKNTNFVGVDIEDSNGDSVNETVKEEQGDQYKVIIANTSGDPIVSAGSTNVMLFNLTFEFTEDFGNTESDVSPDQGRDNSEDVVLETVDEESRLINSTDSRISTDLEEDDVKDLKFETDSDSVEAYNPETVIEENQIDVTHLTTGGDMVGAPVRIDIDVGEAATNDGKLDEIILNNTRNDEDPNQDDQSIDCEGDPTCDGTLVHIPQEGQDSLLENSTYATRNIYNITVVPETGGNNDTGDNVSINNPRGDGGEEIYKRGDVTLNNTVHDTGNVTLAGDIDSVLDKSGTEADGGLPRDGPESLENAQHDVNNDGEIDVVDVTIVAQEYKPP